jgi:hypothetical protein
MLTDLHTIQIELIASLNIVVNIILTKFNQSIVICVILRSISGIDL